MPFVRRLTWVVVLVLGLMAPATLLAQAPEKRGNAKPNTSPFASSPLFWSTDAVLNAYVDNITRHYNLNPQQEEYTRKLLGQKVKSFLETHERDVRGLMAEYMEYQLGQELPDPKVAQEFAKRASPLVQTIRREIFDGNMRWREILNDEQRTKHDIDLKQMTLAFDNIEQGLERWSQGRVQPTDFPSRVGPASASSKAEDHWDAWVKNTMNQYEFNEGQRQTALSVLRELKEEATRYRESNKDKFAELDKATQAIRERPLKTDPEGLAQYQKETAQFNKQRSELEAPFAAMFKQLRDRVESVATIEQKKAWQAKIDSRRAASRILGGNNSASQPASGPAHSHTSIAGSQPASATAPASTQPK